MGKNIIVTIIPEIGWEPRFKLMTQRDCWPGARSAFHPEGDSGLKGALVLQACRPSSPCVEVVSLSSDIHRTVSDSEIAGHLLTSQASNDATFSS